MSQYSRYTGEYRVKIAVFEAGWVIMTQNFTQRGTSPTNHFCTDGKASECLATLPLTVFTQTNFAAHLLVAFEAPFGGLRGNVRCSS